MHVNPTVLHLQWFSRQVPTWTLTRYCCACGIRLLSRCLIRFLKKYMHLSPTLACVLLPMCFTTSLLMIFFHLPSPVLVFPPLLSSSSLCSSFVELTRYFLAKLDQHSAGSTNVRKAHLLLLSASFLVRLCVSLFLSRTPLHHHVKSFGYSRCYGILTKYLCEIAGIFPVVCAYFAVNSWTSLSGCAWLNGVSCCFLWN